MKTCLLTLLPLLFLFLSVARAQKPWVSQTGLTGDQLDSRLEHWSGGAARLRPVCLSGYEENGQTRYAALWEHAEDRDARRVLRGRSAASLIAANAQLQQQGWRLVWLNGFRSDGDDLYNAIYRLRGGADQTLRLGDTLSGHQGADAELSGQGYYLDNLCAFQSGLQTRYAAWWTRGTIQPVTVVSHGLTAEEYQNEFNLRSGQWRLHNICGHRSVVGGQNRYTVVWRRPARAGGWSAVHGMTKANYFAAQGNETMTGRRPVFQQAWAGGGEVYFNAVWEDNGGLPSSRVAQLNQAVTEHMAQNSIPGLTLAISRNGRLVFARGYGLADQEAGAWTGPDHRFRVASVAKPICAVAVTHALERFPGHTLDSRLFGAVNTTLFGNDYGTPPYSTRERAITLRHLLRHTAGWPNDGLLWWHDEPSWGSGHQELIDHQLDSVAQTSDPGDVGRYSNLGYVIAARAVEKLSGQSFEDYTVGEVLARCGIGGLLGMAVGERTRAQQQFMEAAYYGSGDPYRIDPRRMDGSTAWIARPQDLLLLARRVDGDAEHEDILSPAGVTALRTPGSPSSSTGYNHETYGLGWYTDNINNPSFWGHNGSMDGTRAEFILRSNGVSYAWMANTREGNLNGVINNWIAQVNAADAWPETDLFSASHPAYDAWAATHFSALDRGQPGLKEAVWGPSADPDGDGVPNAGEAYLGRDPLTAEPSPFSLAKTGNSLRLRWLRSTADRGVAVSLQTSSDLRNWSTPAGIPVTDRPDLITLIGKMNQEALVPMNAGSRVFARLAFRAR